MSVRGSHDKAVRYIGQLYDAKCNSHWASVPELARKVEKHAPERTLLPLASRVEAQIYQGRSTTSYRATEQEYGQKLAAELPAASNFEGEDVLDAAICLAAISFGIGAFDAALARSPVHLHEVQAPSVGQGEEGWKAVCVVQGTLIRGLAYEHSGEFILAAQTYRSMIAYLSHVLDLPIQCTELRKWSEELLCHICVFFSTDRPDRPSQLGEAMAAFHLLSKHLNSQGWRPLSQNVTFTNHTPRAVWRSYYEALSTIVREDLVYHPSPENRRESTEFHGYLDDDDYLESRIKQRADLRRVEVNYESLLLKETSFPSATSSNPEVNRWVDLVMSNWEILCGPRWTNKELGSGGKVVVARNTLDILYRAATKTLHSTRILRHLFTVHEYLGEFDLALKAFDSYVEIITRGKARADKSGSVGHDIDDDETAVKVAAQAIKLCCRYGSEDQAEKTLEIGEKLKAWLFKDTPQANTKALRDTSHADDNAPEVAQSSVLPPEIHHLALSAIGISQAHYARFASGPTLRSDLQKQAIENLRSSESRSNGWRTESLYALSLALAETRDITGAIDMVKRALNHAEGVEELPDQDGLSPLPSGVSELDKFDQRTKSFLIWHLLTQLLCAREDYSMAANCCSVALEQFHTMVNLLTSNADPNIRKERQQSNSTTSPRRNRKSIIKPFLHTPFERMDDFEKHTVIEMKLTQLSLIEVTESPEAAVNTSNELFSLFTRLFGVQDLLQIRPSTASAPPKSSSGTIRSFFGRSKQTTARPSAQPSAVPSARPSALPSARPSAVPLVRPSAVPTTTTSAYTSRPSSPTNQTPAIQVIAENGSMTETTRSSVAPSPRRNTLKKKNSGSVNGRTSIGSRHGTNQYSGRSSVERIPTLNDGHPPPPSIPETEQFGSVPTPAPTAGQDLGPAAQNMTSVQGSDPVTSHHQQPQKQDVRLPATPPFRSNAQNIATFSTDSPHPHLHKLQEYRSTTSLLIKIWLFVARLYTACATYRDALSCIEEANKLVAAVESAVATEHGASVKRFQETGWGGGKSVENLWADVCNERGRLLIAQGKPHDALPHLERALSHSPDHAESIVALSNLLLDIYAQIIPAEKPDPEAIDIPQAPTPQSTSSDSAPMTNGSADPSSPALIPTSNPPRPSLTTDTRSLNRTAARDRAYGLLSSLTKLPHGWDDSEAWYALARAYEESGQVEKAKEALWTVVGLEDTRPLRKWRDVSPGGFVL